MGANAQLAAALARIEALEAQVAAMATEVRTRRVVVVDEDGQERIATRVAERLSMLEVSVPPRPGHAWTPAYAAMAATIGEEVAPDGEPIAYGGVTVGAGDELGAELAASELRAPERGDRYGDPVERVRARLELYTPWGGDGVVVDHQGMQVAPRRVEAEAGAHRTSVVSRRAGR